MSSILIRRANMVSGGNSPRLPAGYTELAYIESNGNQWIDTGIVPANKKLGAIIDFQFTATSNAVAGVFGSCVSNNTDNLQLTIYSSKWRYKINNWGQYGNVYDSNRHIVSLNMSNGTKLDNVVVTSTQYTIASSNTCSCFLAGYSFNGAIQPVPSERYSFIGKIFSAKLYDNTQLVMDLVPAMRDSDSVVGMYDLVGNTFITNAGSGTFNYGTL